MTNTPYGEEQPALPPIQTSNDPSWYAAAPLYNPIKDVTASGTLAVIAAGVATSLAVANAILIGPAVESDAVWLAAYGLVSLGYFAALVAAFVATGIWTHAARKNAEAISPDWPHTRSAGWAWGGWIVPIVSLWFPFQVVRDIHRASARRAATPRVIGWWWALWIAVLILSRASSTLESEAIEVTGEVGSAQTLAWIVAALTVCAFVLWAITVRRITALQASWMRGVDPSL